MTRTIQGSSRADPIRRASEETVPLRIRATEPCEFGAHRRLTAQEATIGRMLVEGMDERQVAAELCIGAVALRAHLARICAKLDVPGPADLVTVLGRGTMLDFDPRQIGRPAESGVPVPAARLRLTPQEDAVHRLLRCGLDERQVAAELFIGIGAVRSHVAHIQAKLGIEERIRR
ncbi:LuxR C-terminal-related transcriptional regulator [Nakamurella sp.]|uniref:LuxR C-terminal-related transcriptional regulator n=1 Tax=Nakamurella sp. TaxID=1869182 RepID=UPI003782F54B